MGLHSKKKGVRFANHSDLSLSQLYANLDKLVRSHHNIQERDCVWYITLYGIIKKYDISLEGVTKIRNPSEYHRLSRTDVRKILKLVKSKFNIKSKKNERVAPTSISDESLSDSSSDSFLCLTADLQSESQDEGSYFERQRVHYDNYEHHHGKLKKLEKRYDELKLLSRDKQKESYKESQEQKRELQKKQKELYKKQEELQWKQEELHKTKKELQSIREKCNQIIEKSSQYIEARNGVKDKSSLLEQINYKLVQRVQMILDALYHDDASISMLLKKMRNDNIDNDLQSSELSSNDEGSLFNVERRKDWHSIDIEKDADYMFKTVDMHIAKLGKKIRCYNRCIDNIHTSFTACMLQNRIFLKCNRDLHTFITMLKIIFAIIIAVLSAIIAELIYSSEIAIVYACRPLVNMLLHVASILIGIVVGIIVLLPVIYALEFVYNSYDNDLKNMYEASVKTLNSFCVVLEGIESGNIGEEAEGMTVSPGNNMRKSVSFSVNVATRSVSSDMSSV